MRRPTAARKQALVTPASYGLTCLQDEVVKGKLCCFSHPESAGDGNCGLGDIRLTWKCYRGLKGVSGLLIEKS